MPRIQPLCLSRSSLPAGDTFNIPCMTRAAQPLSHIPQLASHHPASLQAHDTRVISLLSIRKQNLLLGAQENFCLNCDGTIRPRGPGLSKVAQLCIKKYFPFVLQLLYVLYKVCISWEPQNGWVATLQCYRTNPYYYE